MFDNFVFRKLIIYPYSTGVILANYPVYEYGVSNSGKRPKILVFNELLELFERETNMTDTLSNRFYTVSASSPGMLRFRVINITTNKKNKISVSFLIENNLDDEKITLYPLTVSSRAEIRNENDVLICDNGKPMPDGTFPMDSKDYWKNAPTLTADVTQDDPDVFKMTCTPANLEAEGIALFGAVGAGDPEFIEAKPIAASINFEVPISELEPGTYTFTAVPFKGEDLGIASTGVELVIPEPEPEPEPEPDPEPQP